MGYKIIVISGLKFKIDQEDFDKVSKHHWYTLKKGKLVYAVNDTSVNGKKIYLHHFLIGNKKGMVVDHINTDTTDNRKENLRFTTKSENAYNVSDVRTDNRSGYSGVSWDKSREKWVVRIKVQGNYKFFGRFDTKEEAIRKADSVNLKYLGKLRRPKKFVIGDIHNGARALAQVIDRSEIDPYKDTIISLGDIVDGWSEPYECVEILLQFRNLIALRGNHDRDWNQWLLTGYHPQNWANGGISTIKGYYRALGMDLHTVKTSVPNGFGKTTKMYSTNALPELIPQEHRDFFRKQLKYYIDEDFNYYVHAGFYKNLSIKDQSEDILYWDRTLWNKALSSRSSQKSMRFFDTDINEIFIGHTTTTAWDFDVPLKADRIWNMDSGAGFDGRLSLMDVDTKELYQSDPLMLMYPDELGRYKPRKKKKLP